MSSKKISRREFLFASATALAGVAFTACTAAPTKTTEAEPTLAPTEVVEATAEPTIAPTLAATATPVPTAPPAREAPQLAELVKQGKLPPLDERLPVTPLTLSPVNTIGKYGGRSRMQTSWLAGFFEEGQYGHSPVRWVDDGMDIKPGLLDTWSANEDNSEWTLHMREGIRWSDGTPATMNDTLWWWENMTVAFDPNNPDGMAEWSHDANGAIVKMSLVDDFTLKMTYGTPAPLTLKQLAMWVKGAIYSPERWIVPVHYLKQFHPKFNSEYKDFETLLQKSLFR
jgi:peptide/nickel transport system substrate-binding protein